MHTVLALVVLIFHHEIAGQVVIGTVETVDECHALLTHKIQAAGTPPPGATVIPVCLDMSKIAADASDAPKKPLPKGSIEI